MDYDLINDCWSKAALIRKNQIESGIDITFHKVFVPIYHKLLIGNRNLKGLDVGAGTGHLASILQSYFSDFVAIEPSISMYNIAKDVLAGSEIKIHNISAQDFKSSADFDFIYSHMCAHTIEKLVDFIFSISDIMNPTGRFVFSIPHPCFYHLYKNYFGDNFEYKVKKMTVVKLTISSDQNTYIEGIPYIHRPLEMYVELLIRAGLAVQSFIEVMPEDNIHKLYSEKWKAPRYCFFVCSLNK